MTQDQPKGNHSKGFNQNKTQENKEMNNQQPNHSQSKSDENLAAINDRVETVVDGLTNAGKHNAANAISRHAEALKQQTSDIQETLSFLLDPDLPYQLAVLGAAKEINDRHLGKSAATVMNWKLPPIKLEIPEVPNFSGFYNQGETIETSHHLKSAQVKD